MLGDWGARVGRHVGSTGPMARACFALILGHSAAAALADIFIDTVATGPEFDGLGGCSAGTGPRLLVDYAPAAREAVLNYLFSPRFGAALDIIKVEIGGGGSAVGTESSFEPRPGSYDFSSGYEWFMMAEAKKRNPEITVYGLAWTFPAWLYAGSNHTCGEVWVGCINGIAAAQYISEWVAVAKEHHNITVDYVGWNNETPWRPEWIVALREELDRRGLQATKIVVGDSGPGGGYQSPGIEKKIAGNRGLSAAATAVGFHYPVSILPPRDSQEFYEALWALPGKQKLWASEEYSTYSDSAGGRCLAKLINRNYVDANLSASIVWDLLWSTYDGLACSGQGVAWAAEPWSSAIGVPDTIWSLAHTTQVTTKGWFMLQKSGPWGSGGSGYLPPPVANDGSRSGGSSRSGSRSSSSSDGSSCSYPYPLRNTSVVGLTSNGASTPTACEAACCALKGAGCRTWLFGSGGGGCWIGAPSGPTAVDHQWNGASMEQPPQTPRLHGGSYVGYVSSTKSDANVSIVMETMAQVGSECMYGNSQWGEVPLRPNRLQICMPDNVCTYHRELAVRATSVPLPNRPGATQRFEPQPSIPLVRWQRRGSREQSDNASTSTQAGFGCCFNFTTQPNSIYSVTTLGPTTMAKGHPPAGTKFVVPPEGLPNGCEYVTTNLTSVPFPLPYFTDFGRHHVRFDDFPEFLTDEQGIWRVRNQTILPQPHADRSGDDTRLAIAQPHHAQQQVLQQLIGEDEARAPWIGGGGPGVLPFSIIGDKSWTTGLKPSEAF